MVGPNHVHAVVLMVLLPVLVGPFVGRGGSLAGVGVVLPVIVAAHLIR